MQEKIGKGGFGYVFSAINQEKNELCAIKVMDAEEINQD